MDIDKLRADFPVLQSSKAIYFDSACTSLKPRAVIDAEMDYYTSLSACAGRSHHTLAKKTEEKFAASRERIAKFVGAKPEELVFTKNTSEGLNLVVRSLNYSSRKKVITTPLEHHSLLLPIMEQQRRGIVKMEMLKVQQDGTIDDTSLSTIDSSTALVAIHHTTNTTGIRAPLEKIVKAAHDAGAMVLIDGAQGVPHSRVDFHKLGADFLAFSGHKMCGPTGIGCLVGKREAFEKLDTFIVGGETVETVSLQGVKWKSAPKRFEAGIQNYAGAIGLAAACDYLSKVGMQNIEEHEKKMARALLEAINSIPNSTIYGSATAQRSALVSFNLKGVAPHQVALMADSLSKIALRSGVFCAQIGMGALGAPKEGAVRASLYLYNTEEEVRIFAEAMQKIAKLG
ncbi:MAG: aminotransferase class V-fold PLP-dependent enzyme [Candidatus Micrarchaeota archaeon]|nr:aminotransferase class V-fold PLP-dependent enzyme [Candidatus Micrarchaeota archaeon]